MSNRQFKDIKINTEFWYNGLFWRKMGVAIAVSDKTMKVFDPTDTITIESY